MMLLSLLIDFNYRHGLLNELSWWRWHQGNQVGLDFDKTNFLHSLDEQACWNKFDNEVDLYI